MAKRYVLHEPFISIAGPSMAALTALRTTTKIDAQREQGVKNLRIRGQFHIRTKTANEGPVVYGFYLDMPTDSAVAEGINGNPQHNHDVIESEEANRRILPIGVIPYAENTMLDAYDPTYREFPFPRWHIPEGVALGIFIYNAGSATLSDIDCDFSGVYTYEWMND